MNGQFSTTAQWKYAVDHAMRVAKVDATDYKEIYEVFVQHQQDQQGRDANKMFGCRVANCGDTAERARYLSIHAQSTDTAADANYQCQSGTGYWVGCNFH